MIYKLRLPTSRQLSTKLLIFQRVQSHALVEASLAASAAASPGLYVARSERADVLATAVPTDGVSGKNCDKFPDLGQFCVDLPTSPI